MPINLNNVNYRETVDGKTIITCDEKFTQESKRIEEESIASLYIIETVAGLDRFLKLFLKNIQI